MAIHAGRKMNYLLMLSILFLFGCSPSESNPDSKGVSPNDSGLTGDGTLASDGANNNPLSVMTYTGRVTDNWQVVIPDATLNYVEPFLWRNWLITWGTWEEGCSLYGYEIQGDVTKPTYGEKKLLINIEEATTNCEIRIMGPWLMLRNSDNNNNSVYSVLAMNNSDKTLTVKSSVSEAFGDYSFGRLFSWISSNQITTENGTTTITSYGGDGTIYQGTIDNQGNIGSTVTALGSLLPANKEVNNVKYLVCDNYLYALGGSGGCGGTCCNQEEVYVASLLDTNRKWTATRKLPLGPATVLRVFCANGFVYVGLMFTGIHPQGSMCALADQRFVLYAAKVGKDGMLSQWIDATNVYPTCDDGTSTTPAKGIIYDINSNFALSGCSNEYSVAPLERGVWVPPSSSAGGDGGTGQPVNQNGCTGSDVIWCANYQVCLPTTGECEYWCRMPSSLVQCFRSMPDEAEQDLFCGTSPVRNLCQ